LVQRFVKIRHYGILPSVNKPKLRDVQFGMGIVWLRIAVSEQKPAKPKQIKTPKMVLRTKKRKRQLKTLPIDAKKFFYYPSKTVNQNYT